MEETSLQFDQHGYLIPYDIVQVDWETFSHVFGYNDHRKNLIDAYKRFLISIRQLLPVAHRHWIDGSFISQKPIPGDMDLVVFIPHTYFMKNADELRKLKKEVAGLIDCYFVDMFPSEHPKYEISRADELTWYHFLRTDRLKGSVELWFDYGN